MSAEGLVGPATSESDVGRRPAADPCVVGGGTLSSDQAFASLKKGITSAITSGSGQQEVALAVRHCLKGALAEPVFGYALLHRTSKRLIDGARRPSLIFSDAVHRYCVEVFTWPHHFRNEKHSHTYWTVTGVIHNRLTFTTYKHASERGVASGVTEGKLWADSCELTVDREIDGYRGDVGYICTPCTHDVFNPTDSPSVSVHIFSLPSAGAADHVVRRERELARQQTDRLEQSCIAVADALGDYGISIGADASDTLEELSYVGTTTSALYCAAQLLRLDRVRGAARLEKLFAQASRTARLECERLVSAAIGGLP